MVCPNCNKEIDSDSRFCRFCGAEFVDDSLFSDDDDDETLQYGDNDNENGSKTVIPEKKKTQSKSKFETKQEKTPVENKKNKALLIQLLVALAVIVVICAVLIFVGTSSGKIGFGETVTDAAGDEVRSGWGKTEIAVEDADGITKVITTDRKLVTPEQILSEYTLVMNKLKTDAPAFDYVRYQNLPADKQNLGAVASFVLPIIEKYVTSKAAAEPKHISAGNATELPVKNSAFGCLVTDAAKIKRAYCEVINDSTYKLVLVFNDELNPTQLSAGATTTSGIVNGVFDPYDAGEYITAISSLAMNDISFNYTNCTAELIYNKDTQQVQSIKMTMYIDATADTFIKQITAQIIDVCEYTIAY